MAAVTQLARYGERHIARGLNRLTNAVIKEGRGSYLHMEDGRKMLDFTTGIGVAGLGHCHPKISKAAADQCLSLVHGQCSIAYHEPYLKLIERLIPVMPHPSLDTFFFWNSGAEAVEASIKLARAATGKQNVIVMQGGYHGRTFGTMALTKSKTVYSQDVFPLMPGVFSVPFPYWHQCGLPSSTPTSELVQHCLFQLDLTLSQQTAPSDTAAIIVEPVLGEGGYVPAPTEFLQGLRKVCDKHEILLIADEVQSGFGRTGKYFAIERSGVKPDIMVMAKGLANGFPLSGIVSRKEIMDRQSPGTMGGTYAGNAVACAAAVACAEAFQEEKVLQNVEARSHELFGVLKGLQKDSQVGHHILDVRGAGLMVGVEFGSPSGHAHDKFRRPDAPKTLASRISKRCLEKGMFLLTTSVFDVVRFIPPLNITKEDMKKGTDIFSESVHEIVREG
ncbi:PLP-dependent transferase [Sistotremastrum niveocremeum HHB9708]|uniref:PLP-dependent transferase n=2 Tax=Sistotremastraceae TaxID=3402574 RepID=A0A165AAE8_9AGAM|nr:PLP-dependent transferase [Sistotremastrum niveocremeum HHB9708]KZT42471.1 PLP-dependent transferase [Sistotremastrum suecicum HHB10207 ss-3]